jgi:hypothetical protein
MERSLFTWVGSGREGGGEISFGDPFTRNRLCDKVLHLATLISWGTGIEFLLQKYYHMSLLQNPPKFGGTPAVDSFEKAS